jgi:hypothetical protein
MPDKYGRMTGEDWMGYANNMFALANQFQKNKAIQSAQEAEDVERMGALYGSTAEHPINPKTGEVMRGTTEYGPGVNQTTGGALERVQKNPALEAQARLKGMQYEADAAAAEAQQLIARNTMLDDTASRLAANFQTDFDMAMKLHPESPDMAIDAVYSKMKNAEGASGFDQGRLRAAVGNKMLEQYTKTDDFILRQKETAVAKTTATMTALAQNSQQLGQKAIAFNQTEDPEMKAAIGKDIVTTSFATMFEPMYGAVFTYAPKSDGTGVDIIYKSGEKANQIYKTIDYANPTDVNEIANAVVSIASNPQAAEQIHKRIQDGQASKLNQLLDRRQGTVYQPTTVYDKNGNAHEVTINDNLFLSNDGSFMMNSMGTKMFPMTDARNMEAMGNIEFQATLDPATERMLLQQRDANEEDLGPEAAMIKYRKDRQMMIDQKQTTNGKITDQKFLDNYVTLLRKADMEGEGAKERLLESITTVYGDIALPAMTLADGSQSPDGIPVYYYLALQEDAMNKAAKVKTMENKPVTEQIQEQITSAALPSNDVMMTKAHTKPGAEEFEQQLALEGASFAPSPQLPRTPPGGSMGGKQVEPVGPVAAIQELASKMRSGDTTDHGTALSRMGGGAYETFAEDRYGAQSPLTAETRPRFYGNYLALHHGNKNVPKNLQSKYEKKVAKYLKNPPPEAPAARKALQMLVREDTGPLAAEVAKYGGPQLLEEMYQHGLFESNGYKENYGPSDSKGRRAVGWWQVRPTHARDWIKTSGMFGPKAEDFVGGYTKEQMLKMSDKELEEFLKLPAVNAMFAVGLYIQHKKAAKK